VYTRMYITEVLDGGPGLGGAPQVAKRLMQNQADIGNYIAAQYGAGQHVTALLQAHITSFIDIARRYRDDKNGGNPSSLDALVNTAILKGDDVANYLLSLNSRWDIRAHMRDHVALTYKEVQLHSSKNYVSDVENFDLIVKAACTMSEILV